ncbi:MAG: H-NS histone family protein, partial [Pseudomonadota bacterium]
RSGMAVFDLDGLSLDELRALRKDVEKTIDSYDVRRRNEALVAVQAVAKEAGFSLDDLIAKGSKRLQPPKYQHPENPALTWSGRGRKPAWFKDLLDAGTEEAALLISA